jgi:hypothetical protein
VRTGDQSDESTSSESAVQSGHGSSASAEKPPDKSPVRRERCRGWKPLRRTVLAMQRASCHRGMPSEGGDEVCARKPSNAGSREKSPQGGRGVMRLRRICSRGVRVKNKVESARGCVQVRSSRHSRRHVEKIGVMSTDRDKHNSLPSKSKTFCAVFGSLKTKTFCRRERRLALANETDRLSNVLGRWVSVDLAETCTD